MANIKLGRMDDDRRNLVGLGATVIYTCVCVYVCACMYTCMYMSTIYGPRSVQPHFPRPHFYVYVCVHVCVCVYTYIITCLLYMMTIGRTTLASVVNLRIYMCTYMYICIYVCMYMYIHVCMYISIYTYMCTYIHTCVCMYMDVYIYTNIWMFTYINSSNILCSLVGLSTIICVCVNTSVRWCICACLRLRSYTSCVSIVCFACVHAHACVCVRRRERVGAYMYCIYVCVFGMDDGQTYSMTKEDTEDSLSSLQKNYSLCHSPCTLGLFSVYSVRARTNASTCQWLQVCGCVSTQDVNEWRCVVVLYACAHACRHMSMWWV